MQSTESLCSRLLNRLTLNSTVKCSHNKDFYTDIDTTNEVDKQQQHLRDLYKDQFIATDTLSQYNSTLGLVSLVRCGRSLS